MEGKGLWSGPGPLHLTAVSPSAPALTSPLPSQPAQAPNEAAVCYRERFARWAAERGVVVAVSTRDSFGDMFDDDATLVYEPASTAAIILTGGDEEAEAAAAEAAKDAEITLVIKQSEEQVLTEYLVYGSGSKEPSTN